MFSVENFFGRKTFRSKNFSAEKFAVRIAEGGNDGGGPGGAEAPPGPSEKIGKYLARKVWEFFIRIM